MECVDSGNIDNLSLYPYFYLKEYVSFIKKTEGKDVVCFIDEFGNSVTCKIWVSSFLKLIQLIYPPLTKYAKRLSIEKEYDFLNKWVSFVIEKRIANRITQPENFAIFRNAPLHSTSSSFGTYYLSLENLSEDELFSKIHPKHRNVIKNAEKKGVIVKYGKECIDDFYSLYKETMQRSNMYCQNLSYFTDLYNNLNQSVICGVVYYKNIPQGGLFNLYTEFGAFYLYGASAKEIHINGSINYLHWNTIKLLKQKGVKRYDFVGARLSDVSGTKLEGIQQFKKRFGAELEKGFLWKMDLNKSKCNFYDALLHIKIRMRGKEIPLDIIDQENKKRYA